VNAHLKVPALIAGMVAGMVAGRTASELPHPGAPQARDELLVLAWWRVLRWLRTLHHWRWKDVRRRFTTPRAV